MQRFRLLATLSIVVLLSGCWATASNAADCSNISAQGIAIELFFKQLGAPKDKPIHVGYSQNFGNITDVTRAQMGLKDKPIYDEIRRSEVTIEYNQFRAGIHFKFNSPRPRSIDNSIKKVFCSADLTGNIDFSSAKNDAGVSTVYVTDLVSGIHEESFPDAVSEIASGIRWPQPFNYSIQETGDGSLYVALE